MMHRLAASLVLSVCLGAVLSPARAADSAGEQQLKAWAGKNLHEVSLDSRTQWADLDALMRMIGNASIVSLGEGLHGSAEPLEFRNRLFEYLVERQGFTAIAIESGITESYAINEYVLGGAGDPKALVEHGITSGLARFPQQVQLVQWMRAYNEKRAGNRKIEFYGMDLSGLSGSAGAPLDIALAYLDGVDADAAASLRKRIAPLLSDLTLDRFADGPGGYARLQPAQRDAATAVMADLVALYATSEAAFIRKTSDRQYELAWRAAIAARYADAYLRQVPVGWSAKSGPKSILGTIGISDRAKIDNIEWIRQRQGREGRLLIFTHLGHAAPTPVSVKIGDEALQLPPMLGMYLKRRYGTELVTIGHFFAQDDMQCRRVPEVAGPHTLEGLLGSIGKPAFVLDLRTAPEPIRAGLAAPHDLFGQKPVHTLRVDEGVDVLFFTARATHSVPCTAQ